MDSSVLKRVITLIDMDCFYCQVELRLNPDLAGKPVAVVQYNQWKQGGIIAVNYEARDRGVTRFMRGEEAKKVCPELCLASVPSVRGKADLTRYREAGAEVADVFSSFSDCVLRASIDEAFIDLTSLVEDRIKSGKVDFSLEKLPSTFIVGHSDLKGNDMDDRQKGLNEWLRTLKQNAHLNNPDFRLFVGALIVEEIRKEVLLKTGFHCSGGIAHNKILAKLVAGLHKPKCQTVLPHENVPELYETLPVKKVRNLGGKFGKTVSDVLSINYMSELYNFSKEQLIDKFNIKNGTWLYEIARGIDHELVTPRLIPESIGCSKNFRGPVAIKTKEKLHSWLKDMAEEVVERLEKDLAENVRRAKLLTISFKQGRAALSRSCPLNAYKAEVIAKDAHDIILKVNQTQPNSTEINPAIENLGLSASKFNSERTSIKSFLREKGKEKTNITSSKIDGENSNDTDNSSSEIFDDTSNTTAYDNTTLNKLSNFSDGPTTINEKKTITSFFTARLESLEASVSCCAPNSDKCNDTETNLETVIEVKNITDQPVVHGKKTITSFFTSKLLETSSPLSSNILDSDKFNGSDTNLETSNEVIDITDQPTAQGKKTIGSFFNKKLEPSEESFTSAAQYIPEPDQSNSSAMLEYGSAVKDFNRLLSNNQPVASGKKSIASFFLKKLTSEAIPSTSAAKNFPVDDQSNTSETIESGGVVTDFNGLLSNEDDESEDNTKLPGNSFFAKMLAKKTEPSKIEVNDVVIESNNTVELPTSVVSEEDWKQVCPECNKKIHLSVYIEHLDYHAAIKLDQAMNGKPFVRNIIPSKTTTKSKGSPVRKKRKIIKPVDQTEITTFFSSIQK